MEPGVIAKPKRPRLFPFHHWLLPARHRRRPLEQRQRQLPTDPFACHSGQAEQQLELQTNRSHPPPRPCSECARRRRAMDLPLPVITSIAARFACSRRPPERQGQQQSNKQTLCAHVSAQWGVERQRRPPEQPCVPAGATTEQPFRRWSAYGSAHPFFPRISAARRSNN